VLAGFGNSWNMKGLSGGMIMGIREGSSEHWGVGRVIAGKVL